MRPTNLATTIALLEAAREAADQGTGHVNYLCFAIPAAILHLWVASDDKVFTVNACRAAGELVDYIQETLRASPYFMPTAFDTVVMEDCLPPDLQAQVNLDLDQQHLIRVAWLDAMIRDLKANGELP